MLPTFLIIGAQKAATTSLHEYLNQHPDVFMPEEKELNFFIEEGRWRLGLEWYESQFAGGDSATHRGEASPGYTFFPFYRGAAQRAASVVPNARLIYLIRHPVERMVSAWAQHVDSGHEDLDLERALLYQANYSLVSCYGMQISQWAACYPRESILVLRSEDLATDAGTTFDRILAHLGLEPGWRPDDLDVLHNSSNGKLIARRPVRRVARMVRSSGRDRLATALGPWKMPRLARPMETSDLSLDPGVAHALLEVFRADFAFLREFVGPDMDLWGIA